MAKIKVDCKDVVELIVVATPGPSAKTGGSGRNQAFSFDRRSLEQQLREVCKKFGIRYEDDRGHRILTLGDSIDHVVASDVLQLLALPHHTRVGLWHISEVAEARLVALQLAPPEDAHGPIADLLVSLQASSLMAEEVVRNGACLKFLFAAGGTGSTGWKVVTELAMACMCKLFSTCRDAVLEWLHGAGNEVLVPLLFARFFNIIFSPQIEGADEGWGIGRKEPPRATLLVLMYLLHEVPQCALAAAKAAASGASTLGLRVRLGPAYPLIFEALNSEDDDDEFRQEASSPVLCALINAVGEGDEFKVRDIKNDMAAYANEEELELFFRPHVREKSLAEHFLQISVGACAEVIASSTRKHGEDRLQGPRVYLEEIETCQKKLKHLQDLVGRLQADITQRHRAMCAMLPFMKVDTSLLIEQSLDGIVRHGWDSIKWRDNYSLLHFAAECIDDPNVIELLSAFANTVNQQDDSGMRPIDYARNNNIAEIVSSLEEIANREQEIVSVMPDVQGRKTSNVEDLAIEEQLKPLGSMPPALRDGVVSVLRYGFDHVQWASGFTPLHLAAQKGHREAVEFLLTARADITLQDDFNLTPLDYAVQGGFEDVVLELQRIRGSERCEKNGIGGSTEVYSDCKAARYGARIRTMTETSDVFSVCDSEYGISNRQMELLAGQTFTKIKEGRVRRKTLNDVFDELESNRAELFPGRIGQRVLERRLSMTSRRDTQEGRDSDFGLSTEQMAQLLRFKIPKSSNGDSSSEGDGSSGSDVDVDDKHTLWPILSGVNIDGVECVESLNTGLTDERLEKHNAAIDSQPLVADGKDNAKTEEDLTTARSRIAELEAEISALRNTKGDAPPRSCKKKATVVVDDRSSVADGSGEEKQVSEVVAANQNAVIEGTNSEGASGGSGQGCLVANQNVESLANSEGDVMAAPSQRNNPDAAADGNLIADPIEGPLITLTKSAEQRSVMGRRNGAFLMGSCLSQPPSQGPKLDATSERGQIRTRSRVRVANQAELDGIRLQNEENLFTRRRSKSVCAQGNNGLLMAEVLDDDMLRKYLKELDLFGRDAVFGKLQEPILTGGLQLTAEKAENVVKQLEVVQQLTGTELSRRKRKLPTWNGERRSRGDSILVDIPSSKQEVSRTLSDTAKPTTTCVAEDTKSITEDVSNAATESARGVIKEATPENVPPETSKQVKGHESSKGKGKAPQPKAPPAAKGKGAGKGKEKQKGYEKTPTKPKLDLKFRLKPLWWTRLLKGVQYQAGETIWDNVEEQISLISLNELEQRFLKGDALQVKKKPSKGKERSNSPQAVDTPGLLRIITEPQLVVGREAATKKLPPLQELTFVIKELDEQRLNLEQLHCVISNFCPTKEQVDLMKELRAQHPTVPLAVPEQYMSVVSSVPGYKARLDSWMFVRTSESRCLHCAEALRRLDDVVSCFKKSKALPKLMGLILGFGNYLNAGSERGQADGFGIEALGQLDAVKDKQGNGLKQYILEIFFGRCPEFAELLIEELHPLLANVRRSLGKDADGGEVLTKRVLVPLEDYDACVAELQKELAICETNVQMIMQYADDPLDQFRFRIPGQLAQAQERIHALIRQRDVTKTKYHDVLAWFKVSSMKSSDFFLLWDNFFIPEAMISGQPEKLKRAYLVPGFCQGKIVTLDNLLILWRLRDPDAMQRRPDAAQRKRTRKKSVRLAAQP